MLDAAAAERRGKTGLSGWMAQAQALWKEHGVSDMTLGERWNYHDELGAQFPAAPLRILYAASGTLPCALVVRDDRAIIEHAIYWSKFTSVGEGNYLAAILNSESSRAKVASLQARGQWGARHFDKVMFTLPIPRFDAKEQLHRDLAAAGAEAEKIASKVDLPEDIHFQAARRHVREALADAGISKRIDGLVAQLLGSR
ncbi:MAG TPA: hypothetical protein VH684_05170 [Xanthobacteraceae bacterium]